MQTVYVDVGCRHNPGPFEIQGTCEGYKVFYQKFELGSNNVGEYLALYWGMFLFPEAIIYTDSVTALSWASQAWCKTKCEMDGRTRALVSKADMFFGGNQDAFHRIKFWDTPSMGENPADFGRKR